MMSKSNIYLYKPCHRNLLGYCCCKTTELLGEYMYAAILSLGSPVTDINLYFR